MSNNAEKNHTPTPPSLKTPKNKTNNPKKKTKNKKTKTRANTPAQHPTNTLPEAPTATQKPSQPSKAQPVKKKKKKAVKQPPALPAEKIITLPAKPDEWLVTPATYDENNNLLTEETLTFLQDGIEITTITLNEENFTELNHFFNSRLYTTEENTTADTFHIRKPLLGSGETDPIMTMTQGTRILATTLLDQKTLRQLIKLLQKQVIKPVTTRQWAKNWWAKHKVLRVFVAIFAAPAILFIIYSLGWATQL